MLMPKAFKMLNFHIQTYEKANSQQVLYDRASFASALQLEVS